LKISKCWYQKYYKCPYCGEEHQTETEDGDVEKCLSCGEEFEIGEVSS